MPVHTYSILNRFKYTVNIIPKPSIKVNLDFKLKNLLHVVMQFDTFVICHADCSTHQETYSSISTSFEFLQVKSNTQIRLMMKCY